MHCFVRSVLSVTLLLSPLVAQPPASQPAALPEKTISQQEAEELFRSVDELTRFASKATGLPLKQSVKRELTSRDRLEQFLLAKLDDDEDAKRFERGELVIKKFGLTAGGFSTPSIPGKAPARTGRRILRLEEEDRIHVGLAFG